jgi:hypothetical protein
MEQVKHQLEKHSFSPTGTKINPPPRSVHQVHLVSLAMASSLPAAKQQLRKLMKQKLSTISQDSITTQSMITDQPTIHSFIMSVRL